MEDSLPRHELERLRAVAGDPAELERLVRLRLDGEPLQYLEGTAAFGPFELIVDRRVLIPRPETEQLWELARSVAGSPRLIVDLCTGSGALAVALARSFPDAQVIGTDLSADAIEVARLNGEDIANVEFRHGDLFDALGPEVAGRIDLLVSNPPYVAEDEYDGLPVDVRREPRMALVAGPTGLEVYERLGEQLGEWLSPDGVFLLEIGETQGQDVRRLLRRFGASVRTDLAGRDRFVFGRHTPSPAEVLRAGGVVGVPTDTVYGLAVDPTSPEAVNRLYELKGRPGDKPIALLVADVESASQLVHIPEDATGLAADHWPGALTLVTQPMVELPAWVGDPETRSVGVRVPDRPDLVALLTETGPLAVTSANLSGTAPAESSADATAVFGASVDLYVEGRCPGGLSSTVVDVTRRPFRVLRQGPIVIDLAN